ncbi:dihydropteroate synthase [soil metagenome]
MGILNVTPDSFSDGGQYSDLKAALVRVEQMLSDGAAIIDVGGESTRPAGAAYGDGAQPIAGEEERRRVLPIIEAIVTRFPEAIISIDTYRPSTARAALQAGAHVVNDVYGQCPDEPEDSTVSIAAEFGAPLVVMHAGKSHQTATHHDSADDLVADVIEHLKGRAAEALQSNVNHVILDPGIGFGKGVAGDIALISTTADLVRLGHPVMVGISRKRTAAAILGYEPDNGPVPVTDRLFGSLGLTAAAVVRGASIVRTHDVKPTVELLKALTAVPSHALAEA